MSMKNTPTPVTGVISPKTYAALGSAPVSVLAVYLLGQCGVHLPGEVIGAGTGLLASIGAYIARDGLRNIGRRFLDGQTRGAGPAA